MSFTQNYLLTNTKLLFSILIPVFSLVWILKKIYPTTWSFEKKVSNTLFKINIFRVCCMPRMVQDGCPRGWKRGQWKMTNWGAPSPQVVNSFWCSLSLTFRQPQLRAKIENSIVCARVLVPNCQGFCAAFLLYKCYHFMWLLLMKRCVGDFNFLNLFRKKNNHDFLQSLNVLNPMNYKLSLKN